MPRSFVSLDAYLERLPDGLAAYPNLTAKASSLRSTLADAPVPLTTGMGLPTRLEELVRAPPAASDWVKEVELWAVALCVYDVSFAKEGLEGYGTFAYTMARRLLRSPAYKILFAVLSPERLLLGAAHRWAAFHRGTVLEVMGNTKGKGTGSFRLSTPPYVLPELAHVALAQGIRAALDMAQGEGTEVSALVESPTTVRFEARWR